MMNNINICGNINKNTERFLQLVYNGVSTLIEMPCSFCDLLTVITKCYLISCDSVVKLKVAYVDMEGDEIDISNENDYEALEMYMQFEHKNIMELIINNKNDEENKEMSCGMESDVKGNESKVILLSTDEIQKEIEEITQQELPAMLSKLYDELKQKVEMKLQERILNKLNQNLLSQSQNKGSKLYNTNEHIGIHCNNCDCYPIKGIRYKCSVCNCFNLCENCEVLVGDKHEHPLYKLNSPSMALILHTQLSQGNSDVNIRRNVMRLKGALPQKSEIDYNALTYTIEYNSQLIDSKSLNSNEINIATTNNNTNLYAVLKITNTSSVYDFPSPFYLMCVDSSDKELICHKVKINNNLLSNKTIKTKLIFDLSKVKRISHTIVTKWSFYTVNKTPFNNNTFTINIIYKYNSPLKIHPKYKQICNGMDNEAQQDQIPFIKYIDLISQIKREFCIFSIESDNDILLALIEANGDKTKAVKLLCNGIA